MVKGTITTMVTRLFPWSSAQELDNPINFWFQPEPRVFMDSRNYANQKVQSLEAVYPTFPYAMPMTKKSEFFEALSIDKLEKMKLWQDYRSL
ncbi:hypothetical protein Bca4012_074201 [Brassica carinata]|uniref:(rape) hypothetical protein n=1 Tax=Brassica napus TaxID=3708 RepID=A0A816L0S7_BRANA|nr:unnamed protein product [Brassica napus]